MKLHTLALIAPLFLGGCLSFDSDDDGLTNAEEEEYGSEYTDSNYSGFEGGQNEEEPSGIGASEVQSELDNLLDFES